MIRSHHGSREDQIDIPLSFSPSPIGSVSQSTITTLSTLGLKEAFPGGKADWRFSSVQQSSRDSKSFPGLGRLQGGLTLYSRVPNLPLLFLLFPQLRSVSPTSVSFGSVSDPTIDHRFRKDGWYD